MFATRLTLAASMLGAAVLVGCDSTNSSSDMKHDSTTSEMRHDSTKSSPGVNTQGTVHTAPYSDGTPKQDNVNPSAPSTGIGPGKAGSTNSNNMGPVRSEGGSDK